MKIDIKKLKSVGKFGSNGSGEYAKLKAFAKETAESDGHVTDKEIAVEVYGEWTTGKVSTQRQAQVAMYTFRVDIGKKEGSKTKPSKDALFVLEGIYEDGKDKLQVYRLASEEEIAEMQEKFYPEAESEADESE